jgi:organic radical activating enzyme
MTDLEFRQQVLDPISASFCAAKWYNATIWLGSGMTTSCHHPPAHLVDKDKVLTNPRLLHNTDQKKQDRAQMLAGERPLGCEYCWKIEDMGRDAVSDRVYKSKIYPIEALDAARNTPVDQDVNLKTLEIAFDRTCQFACSYCNPAFSSTWVRDIRRHGPYENLVSDGRNHFTHDHAAAQLWDFGQPNPYIDAFFQWWESDLHRTLQELRITGGEPLMSGHVWRLIDWFRNNQGRSATRLAVNSNLGTEVDVDRLLESTQGMPVEIYTSMEAVGIQAEYIRDGLVYSDWRSNVLKLLNAGRTVHFMATINALCFDSLCAHLNQLLEWKRTWGRDRVNFTLNILRFPSFQSPLVLSEQLRDHYKTVLQSWLEYNTESHRIHLLHEHEINHMQRLIDYLDVVKTPHRDAFELPKLRSDFKFFYQQYDLRRSKSFQQAFSGLQDFGIKDSSSQILTWYNSL